MLVVSVCCWLCGVTKTVSQRFTCNLVPSSFNLVKHSGTHTPTITNCTAEKRNYNFFGIFVRFVSDTWKALAIRQGWVPSCPHNNNWMYFTYLFWFHWNKGTIFYSSVTEDLIEGNIFGLYIWRYIRKKSTFLEDTDLVSSLPIWFCFAHFSFLFKLTMYQF